jgi:Domain of unknown function (DUF3859)
MVRCRFLLYLALPIALVIAPLSLYAQSVTVDRIEILERGIYHAQVTGETPAGSTATGQVNQVSKIQFVQHTTTIPMRLGVRFGFRYAVVGSPEGANVPLKLVTIFPGPGLYNPERGQTFHREEYTSTKTLGEPTMTGYVFAHSWELVPGVWTLQIWYQDRLLTEQRFTVVRP